MDDFKKVIVLENEVEASLLEAILTERQIPFLIKPYHDAAYDGIFVTQKGWGAVYAGDSDKAEIEQIVSDLRNESVSEDS